MSILTVNIPTGTLTLHVADNVLVYDGRKFVQPAEANYVMLYAVPVNGAMIDGDVLITSGFVKASIVSYVDTPVTPTDPAVVAEPDPSNGACICFCTCQGTHITYVQVTNQ